jgi:hypothetical protein
MSIKINNTKKELNIFKVDVSKLPGEVIVEIITFCKCKTIANIKYLSKRFFNLANENYVWISILKNEFKYKEKIESSEAKKILQNFTYINEKNYTKISKLSLNIILNHYTKNLKDEKKIKKQITNKIKNFTKNTKLLFFHYPFSYINEDLLVSNVKILSITGYVLNLLLHEEKYKNFIKNFKVKIIYISNDYKNIYALMLSFEKLKTLKKLIILTNKLKDYNINYDKELKLLKNPDVDKVKYSSLSSYSFECKIQKFLIEHNISKDLTPNGEKIKDLDYFLNNQIPFEKEYKKYNKKKFAKLESILNKKLDKIKELKKTFVNDQLKIKALTPIVSLKERDLFKDFFTSIHKISNYNNLIKKSVKKNRIGYSFVFENKEKKIFFVTNYKNIKENQYIKKINETNNIFNLTFKFFKRIVYNYFKN